LRALADEQLAVAMRRMALAKDLLRRKEITVAEVADKVGYGSSSTFSVAFARQVG
jgi:AraC-like DNA-binding protein